MVQDRYGCLDVDFGVGFGKECKLKGDVVWLGVDVWWGGLVWKLMMVLDM